MPENLKTKCAYIVDNGIFCSFAERLARDFGRVLYAPPCFGQAPSMNRGKIGTGLEGIEVVEFGERMDEADIFCFPDVGYGHFQQYLVEQGKKVWGARMGEELELFRVDTKKHLKSLGIPIGEYTVVHGMKALRSYLAEHKNVHVKIDKYRGSFESFRSKDYKSSEPKLDEVASKLGPFGIITDFICEDDLPGRVEIGIDCPTMVNGQFPRQLMAGIEIKDAGYVGIVKPYASFPKAVTDVDKALADTFKNYGYAGPYSSEVRVGKDGIGYPVDLTCRLPSPPNEAYQENCANISQMVWAGAHGELLEPEWTHKYAAELIITSDMAWADKHFQPVDFDKKYRNNIKIRNHIIIEGQDYCVPQGVGFPEVGAVIGSGDTLQSAIEQVKEIADTVSGYYLKIPLEAFDQAQEEIDKLKQYGIDMF